MAQPSVSQLDHGQLNGGQPSSARHLNDGGDHAAYGTTSHDGQHVAASSSGAPPVHKKTKQKKQVSASGAGSKAKHLDGATAEKPTAPKKAPKAAAAASVGTSNAKPSSQQHAKPKAAKAGVAGGRQASATAAGSSRASSAASKASSSRAASAKGSAAAKPKSASKKGSGAKAQKPVVATDSLPEEPLQDVETPARHLPLSLAPILEASGELDSSRGAGSAALESDIAEAGIASPTLPGAQPLAAAVELSLQSVSSGKLNRSKRRQPQKPFDYRQCELDPNMFQLGRKLGSGSFATVYLAKQADGGPRKYVVKKLDRGRADMQEVRLLHDGV